MRKNLEPSLDEDAKKNLLKCRHVFILGANQCGIDVVGWRFGIYRGSPSGSKISGTEDVF